MIKDIHYHFSKIAQKYNDLRTADSAPMLFIRKKLLHYKRIEAADIGCGTGRYDLKAFQYLGKKLYLHCIDCNEEMLKQLTANLIRHKIQAFRAMSSYAEQLPLEGESLDCVFAFNSIHHFKLPEFLKEGLRVLKEGGWMFLYTRLRSQNSRNIWGRYFPLFTEKETRLYELDELEAAFRQTPGLRIQSIEHFEYKRISCLDRLLEQVQSHHYSTFFLYTKRELDEAVRQFQRNLRGHCRNGKDGKGIRWVDENTLILIRKETGR